ncbi:hypothetical protein TorRG33x02_004070 [Trema orientale]|uniref:Uncharacterized protein n=1 Tax=Trema orientale TaxID=63057 RepID=A0A2P5G219_TREOI|nr:hypothetical protein TorRG33x02_004070 [Trema orientale]
MLYYPQQSSTQDLFLRTVPVSVESAKLRKPIADGPIVEEGDRGELMESSVDKQMTSRMKAPFQSPVCSSSSRNMENRK